MAKFIIGFALGIAISAICIPAVIISKGRVEFRRGVMKAADALEKEFGRYDGRMPYKVLFSIDRTNAVSIETNGVKTIRMFHEAF